MTKEKIVEILKSSILTLSDVHLRSDDELIEERANEVIMDLEYLVKELSKTEINLD